MKHGINLNQMVECRPKLNWTGLMSREIQSDNLIFWFGSIFFWFGSTLLCYCLLNKSLCQLKLSQNPNITIFRDTQTATRKRKMKFSKSFWFQITFANFFRLWFLAKLDLFFAKLKRDFGHFWHDFDVAKNLKSVLTFDRVYMWLKSDIKRV